MAFAADFTGSGGGDDTVVRSGEGTAAVLSREQQGQVTSAASKTGLNPSDFIPGPSGGFDASGVSSGGGNIFGAQLGGDAASSDPTSDTSGGGGGGGGGGAASEATREVTGAARWTQDMIDKAMRGGGTLRRPAGGGGAAPGGGGGGGLSMGVLAVGAIGAVVGLAALFGDDSGSSSSG